MRPLFGPPFDDLIERWERGDFEGVGREVAGLGLHGQYEFAARLYQSTGDSEVFARLARAVYAARWTGGLPPFPNVR